MSRHHRQNGFTLIEMLVVLLMMTILIAISSSFIYRTIQMNKETAFKSQLTQDLYMAQRTAITQNQTVLINFYSQSQTYYIRLSSGAPDSVLIKRDLPQTVQLLETSTLTSFRILPSGSTNSFGVIRFKINNKPYSIHFYLGKGRFYAEE
ncbi:prepilin-type N-terminal cleavage/methylation domain-containing protein [Jeotgalibacillus sp. S-D1]|uniref:competence type IV pilus minor pilin ComGD n=1 Tax=Jeotgalibacillus sp. S-D1 TaxID=2552189 RepID=UPI00105A58A1|nr:competence type IV pilus minor pilin ComGD [Jeotgalibacillus sp. S-D1]TDL34598.1 prepilin-type N-terminal cleavage/methylation domain-containing protein [Jeotgalibacillus sp. S-D1]